MVRTTHIRMMLQEALDACIKAEQMSQADADRPAVLDEPTPFNPGIERLLNGAITNALHAAAEIRDESFRYRYGEDGFTRG